MSGLVLAKAPKPGLVKTRLGADVGMEYAAELAAAALLDTLLACTEAFGAAHCRLALAGDLAEAIRGEELIEATRGWTVTSQRGDDFAERLVNAHLEAGDTSVVQVGMDTPQVTATQLRSVAESLATHEAVLGHAADGGWWVLGLRDPRQAVAINAVEMSTPHTGADTEKALRAAGLSVALTEVLSDVDTVADAEIVATQSGRGHFATAWDHRLAAQPGAAR